jgi:putative membrane protein
MMCAVDFVIRVILNAVALWVAVALLDGVDVTSETTWGKIGTLLLVALIFGIVNAIIRPVAMVLSCPLIVLTLGLFALVVNALLFWLVAGISDWFDIDFEVDGFWAAFWGAIIVGLVSWILSAVVRPDRWRS